MKKLLHMALIATAALIAACSGKGGSGDSSGELLTDTITIADSMNYAGSTVAVTIIGQYPSGGDELLVDSVRQWLADCLSWGTYSTDEPIIRPSRQEIADGKRLLDHVNGKLQAAAKRDFIFLAADSIKTGYEYQIHFAPDFRSDSLLTYEYNTYSYLGGAHGSSVARVATFAVSSGRRLTYANTFHSDASAELLALIRRELWKQYFEPAATDEGAPSNIKEALLIEPESMELPICSPQFGAKGVTFTYGQYEIAPYSAGMPACTIPYSDLRSLMRPEILPLLP